jgi:hypothetical protein
MEVTCGALIDAGVIAGCKTGGAGTVMVTRQMQEKFREKCGVIRCKDLKAMTDGKPLCPCEECVRQAVLCYGEAVGLD